MTRNVKRQMVGLGAVVAIVVLAAAPAQAGWGHWRSYAWAPIQPYSGYASYGYGCGSYGCGSYGCCETPVVDTCCATSCRRGCFGRWHGGWRTLGCCDPCAVAVVDDCCSGTTSVPADAPTYSPSDQIPTPAPPAPAAGTPNEPAASATRANSGLLTVYVPADAVVTINGYETSSTGTHREYVSHGLQADLAYTYEVRATVVRDGKQIEDVKTATLVAGDKQGLAFGFNTLDVADLAVAQ